MELDFALLARSATASQGELFIHGGGLAQLAVQSLPAAMPIAVAARFAAAPEEFGSEHTIGLRVYEPLMLAPSATPEPMSFTLEADPHEPEGELSVMLVMSIGAFRINAIGQYRFELALDGTPVKTLSLHIRRGEPQVGPTTRTQGQWEQTPAESADIPDA